MTTPEQGNLIMADPAELMRDNPAALIVNKDSYQEMGAYFYPKRLDPPQVVRVATFSATGEEAIKLFVVDGMTRTKYAADHKDTKLPDYPDFSFERIAVRDITEGALRNPKYVPQEERQIGQDALTIVQYLRAVIPPTVEHAQIAPDRIAAHLINGWENMVGRITAEKFSALAAISLLKDASVPIATERLLKQHLAQQQELIAEEIPEERVGLEQALLKIGAVIRESTLNKEKIFESAYVLVSSNSEVIGGERYAWKQIYGLLSIPQVEKRLREYSQVGVREKKREELGHLIANVFKRTAGQPRAKQITITVDNVLKDTDLDLILTERILKADDVVDEYTKVRQELNINKLKVYYSAAVKRAELTSAEEVLIANLGGKTYLLDSNFRIFARVIQQADVTIQQIDTLISELRDKSQEFLERGVKDVSIHQALSAITAARSSLLEPDSYQTISRNVNRAREIAAEKRDVINREIKSHKLGIFVNEIFGHTRPDVVSFFMKEDLTQEVQVRRALEQLKGLDLDLQARVLSNGIRLDRALQRQEERKETILKPTTEVTPPSPKPVTPIRKVIPVPTLSEPQEPVSAPTSDRVTFDKRAAEEKRIRINNEELRQAISIVMRTLKTIDLDKSELSPEALEEFDSMLKEAGRLRFGRLDLVKAMENYPKILQQLQRYQQGA